MSNKKVFDLDFFTAGVPPSILFEMDLDRLKQLVFSSNDPSELSNPIAELGLIGLAAYFEAFCKNQFAAIINICPQTLKNFTAKRRNTTLDLEDILKISDRIDHKLGFLLSEQYDFGSAKTVNSLYGDLLYITPFSKPEAKRYGEFLNDRNLLVHHGGIYTFKYQGQEFARKRVSGIAHWDSLVIEKKDFLKWSNFLEKITAKIIAASYKALKEFIEHEGIKLSKNNRGAFEYLSFINRETNVS